MSVISVGFLSSYSSHCLRGHAKHRVASHCSPYSNWKSTTLSTRPIHFILLRRARFRKSIGYWICGTCSSWLHYLHTPAMHDPILIPLSCDNVFPQKYYPQVSSDSFILIRSCRWCRRRERWPRGGSVQEINCTCNKKRPNNGTVQNGAHTKVKCVHSPVPSSQPNHEKIRHSLAV